MDETVEPREAKDSQKRVEHRLCCVHLTKKKLLAASLLAKAPGGGGEHYKEVERLEVSIAMAPYYQSLISVHETRR